MNNGLSIVLPVFNEENNIEDVICRITSFARQKIQDFEIIAVDDGSTDSTLNILNDLRQANPGLKIITHNRNKGYGCAVRAGIEAAQKDWLFFMDSDGQFRIDDFESFWKMKDNYDFIIGYRSVRRDVFYRKCLGGAGNFLTNAILCAGIKDINCAFKLFRTSDLKKFTLFSTGGSISFELLYHLLSFRKSFIQLPVRHYERDNGRQTGGNPKVIFKIVMEGIKLILKGRRN